MLAIELYGVKMDTTLLSNVGFKKPWKVTLILGISDGWCSNWNQGSDHGDSFWINLEEDECWKHCQNDPSCFQAVYEIGQNEGGTQCWIGMNSDDNFELLQQGPLCSKLAIFKMTWLSLNVLHCLRILDF